MAAHLCSPEWKIRQGSIGCSSSKAFTCSNAGGKFQLIHSFANCVICMHVQHVSVSSKRSLNKKCDFSHFRSETSHILQVYPVAMESSTSPEMLLFLFVFIQ